MSKFYITLIFILSLKTFYAQCPPLANGQLVFNTQQEVDDFALNYPNCSIVNGDLIITGTVNDVNPLNFLNVVNGRLAIFRSEITSISSFNNLTAVSNNIGIMDNNILTKITGFNGLKIMGKSSINNNDSLLLIDGFNNLEVAGDIYIQGNIELTTVTGYRSLREVIRVLSFYGNAKLTNVSEFETLELVGQQLQFYWANITEITGFNNLERIGYNITGGLSLQFNPNLTSVTGFASLQEVGRLLIGYNDKIEDISGLRNLEVVTQFMYIRDNLLLASLEGLNSLVEVGDYSNPGPTTTFNLSNNPLLSECTILCPLLMSNGINGTIEIATNLEGCNSEVEVLNECSDDNLIIPNFFTPNNDGQNDTWQVVGEINQRYSVYIYDRFGKILAKLNPSFGWDGIYNGEEMPSTDYWYRVDFEDGSVEKGHFSLIRR